MIIYAWKFITNDEPENQLSLSRMDWRADHLQFSVQRDDVDLFCNFINKSKKKEHLLTTNVPKGSPHYLDFEKDIILCPRNEFQKIGIYKTATIKVPVEIMIDDQTMNISLSDEGCKLFIALLQKSKSSGYLYEHQLDVLIKEKAQQDERYSKLIIWGAYENKIIYY
jgi:hypothetical protein